MDEQVKSEYEQLKQAIEQAAKDGNVEQGLLLIGKLVAFKIEHDIEE